jgi:hypothetical protein
MVAAVLDQINPIAKDLIMVPANAKITNRVSIRTNLPSVAPTRMNEGVPRSKSRARQQVDSVAVFSGRSEVDARAKYITDVAAYRWDEDQTFIEAIAQAVASAIFYGSEAVNEATFNGLAVRYASLSGPNAAMMVSAGGSGSDNTSIFCVDHSDRYVYGIYPEGGEAGGLDIKDRGLLPVTDASSNPYDAWTTIYEQALGLVVKDPRHAGRVCNLDVSDLATAGAASDTSARVTKALIDLEGKMQPPNGAKRIYYCRQEVLSAISNQVMVKANMAFGFGDWAGQRVLTFRGFPMVRCDQISVAEATIS